MFYSPCGTKWYLQGTDGEMTITGRAVSGKFVPLLSTELGVGYERNKPLEAILQPSLQPLMGRPFRFPFSALH